MSGFWATIIVIIICVTIDDVVWYITDSKYRDNNKTKEN